MFSRTVLAALALCAVASCGRDDPSGADGTPPTTDDLIDRTFESTAVAGHELVADTIVVLSFAADRVGARAGCNSMSGGYSITDGTLEIGVMASTMMACSDELAAQDTWLSGFLSSGPAIALDGDTLTLTADDATLTLRVVQPAELERTVWSVTGIVANEAVSSLPTDAEASITITDGRAAIRTGCNSGSASVELTDTTISFGPIALTRMACPPGLADLEAAVLAVLDGEVAYEIAGDELVLYNEGGIGLRLTAG